jgi:thymidine kinase
MERDFFKPALNDQIKVGYGPMGVGKTDWMLSQLHNSETSDIPVVAVMSVFDERRSDNIIVSGSGNFRQAYRLEHLGEIIQTIEDDPRQDLEAVKVVGVDEAGPFFEDAKDFRNTTLTLAKMGKIVVVSSLDVAGNGDYFPAMEEILKLNPIRQEFYGFCDMEKCTCQKATHTGVFDYKTGRPINRKGMPLKLPDNPSHPRYSYMKMYLEDWLALAEADNLIDFEEILAREE